MTNIISWALDPIALILILPFLDRWGGGGFEFLSKKLPGDLKDGFKAARRIGIPLAIWLVQPTLVTGACMVFLGILLSLNLDWIEEEAWLDGMLYSLGFIGFLWPVAGVWGISVAIVWFLGVLISNNVLGNTCLPWRYVELARGLAIAVAINLHQIG